jgi:hypothetical protein
VAPYADKYIEYDAVHRVTKIVIGGAGCSCTADAKRARKRLSER